MNDISFFDVANYPPITLSMGIIATLILPVIIIMFWAVFAITGDSRKDTPFMILSSLTFISFALNLYFAPVIGSIAFWIIFAVIVFSAMQVAFYLDAKFPENNKTKSGPKNKTNQKP